jgi:hypothetical protein
MKLKTMLVAISMLMLSACSTVSGQGIATQPVIQNKVCKPPAEFMQKHPSLEALKGSSITEKQAIDTWVNDVKSYNDLNIDHSALIDFISKYCVNK